MRFHFTNDAGDIIAAMTFVRQMGGGDVTIGNHYDMEARKMRPSRPIFKTLQPLFETLPYVKSIRYSEDTEGVDYDFSDWREVYSRVASLAHAQAAYFGVHNLDVSPWLTAKKDPRSDGKVVVTRTSRYMNHSFPWFKIYQKYKDKLMFVGFKEEHEALEKKVNGKINHVPTADFLEVAELISGSELYIGNQTAATWVAMGLGHPLIQETYTRHADSMIPNPKAQFVIDGKVKLPTI